MGGCGGGVSSRAVVVSRYGGHVLEDLASNCDDYGEKDDHLRVTVRLDRIGVESNPNFAGSASYARLLRVYTWLMPVDTV